MVSLMRLYRHLDVLVFVVICAIVIPGEVLENASELALDDGALSDFLVSLLFRIGHILS